MLLLSATTTRSSLKQIGSYRAYTWEPKVSAVMSRATRVLANALQVLPRIEGMAVERAINHRLTVDAGVVMDTPSFAASVYALGIVFPLDVRLLAVEMRALVRAMKAEREGKRHPHG